MAKRRVVVTGLGMLTCLGTTVQSTWSGLLASKSGIAPISLFDTEDFSVRIGGAVPDFDLDAYLPRKEARRMDGFIQYGMVAGIQAMTDSGIEISDANRHKWP